MSATDQLPNFGPCCACRESGPTVRNFMMLHLRAAVPGTGWGCVVCGVPNDGAMAILCDRCVENGQCPDLRDVILGLPAERRRMPFCELAEAFDHDRSQHPELSGESTARKGESA